MNPITKCVLGFVAWWVFLLSWLVIDQGWLTPKPARPAPVAVTLTPEELKQQAERRAERERLPLCADLVAGMFPDYNAVNKTMMMGAASQDGRCK